MSSSRTGAARSAAILLVSRHISDISNAQNANPVYGSKYNQNMREYLQRQLEQQKELLFLDIPSLRNQKNFLSKLTTASTRHGRRTNNTSASNQSDDPDHDHDAAATTAMMVKDGGCGNSKTSATSTTTANCHVYENCLNTRDTRDGSSSFDYLDDDSYDGQSSSGSEKFMFGALPTPASEQANFAVIFPKITFCFLFALSQYG